MKLFFDEDNGTGIPRALQLLHIPETEILFPAVGGRIRKGSSDAEWMQFVGRHRFLAISQNRRILDSPQERAMLMAANAGVVFLASGRERASMVMKLLLNRWEWLDHLDRLERPFAFVLPFRGRPRRAI